MSRKYKGVWRKKRKEKVKKGLRQRREEVKGEKDREDNGGEGGREDLPAVAGRDQDPVAGKDIINTRPVNRFYIGPLAI